MYSFVCFHPICFGRQSTLFGIRGHISRGVTKEQGHTCFVVVVPFPTAVCVCVCVDLWVVFVENHDDQLTVSSAAYG